VWLCVWFMGVDGMFGVWVSCCRALRRLGGGSVCVCGEGGVGELCRVGVLCDMSLVSGTRGVAALIEFVGIVGCGIYCPGYFGVGDV
jgi:hypothetical protein